MAKKLITKTGSGRYIWIDRQDGTYCISEDLACEKIVVKDIYPLDIAELAEASKIQ